MRCVSYTRTVGVLHEDEIPSDIIARQNKSITAYAGSHGWKISEKYSDRKKDAGEEAAFRDMVTDGISRRFELVVMDSIFRCGKGLADAEQVMARVFFPAGIHFAVVEDDFCSIGKTQEEVNRYFDICNGKRLADMSRNEVWEAEERGELSLRRIKYGFKLSDDRTHLMINEETAAVVRRIYQMYIEGSSYADIARKLTEERVMPLHEHLARAKSKNPDAVEVGCEWHAQNICRILKNPIYMGEGYAKVRGVKCRVEVDPILPRETFELTQKLIEERTVKVKRNYRCVHANILHYKVFMKEDNASMDCYGYEGEDGEWQRMFVKHHSYRYMTKEMRAGGVPYEEVISKVKDVIAAEHQKVEIVIGMLQTKETGEYKKSLYQDYVDELRMVFFDMDAIVQERCRLSSEKHGGIVTASDYEESMKKLWKKEEELEEKFAGIEEKIDNIESYFGLKNKWIKKYRRFDQDKEITREMVKKMVDRVLIDADKNIEVYLLDTDGKKFFPNEWFEERSVTGNGKNEQTNDK